MMDSNRFHLLMSDLHKLLGSYSKEEFRDAAMRSEDCREMILTLADAGVRIVEPENQIAIELSEERPLRIESGSPPGTYADVEEIEDILRRSGRTETTRDMQAIIHAFGLKVELTSKSGRVRNLNKLARAIAASPQRVRNHLLRQISKASRSETQGWLDVIRNRR